MDVRNAGEGAGSDVAQMYTHQERSSVLQPIRSLRAVERIVFQLGESKHVRMTLQAS